MTDIFNNLIKIVQDEKIDSSDLNHLHHLGLVTRVSWTQYIITQRGNKYLNIYEKFIL